VAEVSKNWFSGHEMEPGLLAERFERVIAVNHKRGYRLQTFNLSRTMTGPNSINETIIAVFERRDDAKRGAMDAEPAEAEGDELP
jgi:hypothetical protein